MQVETRESPSIAAPEVAPTVWRRRSTRLSAMLAAAVIVAAGAVGVLRLDGGGGNQPTPNPAATAGADADGYSVIPFPSVPIAVEGVSSVDG